jgi:polyisoprenoid-binding protein YceI
MNRVSRFAQGFVLAVALAAIAVAGLASVTAQPAAAATETYKIDAVHSGIRFSVRHLFSPTPGRFSDFAGTLKYDAAHPENSQIELTIQAASIDTDNDRRDQHLQSEDFLFVEKFPTLTFKSTSIVPTEKAGHFQVTGDFTLRGVTHPVTLAVQLLGFGEVAGMGYRGGFTATTTINRQDFGVKWNKVLDTGGTLLADEVQIECALEVVRETP